MIPFLTQKKLIKSDHPTIHKSFSCIVCLEYKSSLLFLVGGTVDMTACAHALHA